MTRCFSEYHRVLKPGRWITIVFSQLQELGVEWDSRGVC